MGWQEEHALDHRRRLRNGTLVSLAIHGLVFATLVISPPRTHPPLPEVLSVDLIAAPSAARPAPPRPVAKPAAKPAPKPAPKPVPEAAPEPPPPPPPPIAKAPVQVLPENAPSQVKKVEPKPLLDKKPEPKPIADSIPPRRVKQKELSYEDAMAALDDELGPEEDPDLLQPAPEAPAPESTGSPAPRAGVVVSQAMVAWATATTRHIQNNWKGISSYEGRGLATTLELELTATGTVLGTPRVVRSSGDPYFDDNTVRAVLMVNPLPPPPRAGTTHFVFRSEDF
jgi:colicin import membrane protein